MSRSTDAIQVHQRLPDVTRALTGAQAAVATAAGDHRLHHLVHLRASQINQCSYCVNMHLREAREDGEQQARLDQLVVWRHVDVFSSAEKAALAWTEALTRLDPGTDLAPLRTRLRLHFGDAEIAALTADIAMINLWNRIMVADH
ncbi:carboxymuconolactone decarboxylase family protein [Luteimonas sp. BDR2-5]|uniref:carboxymuconolactone decarboxylase family protein n=1 Tax=Proluteimonas luteida TaxID=2878685 RepID=UPI001E3D38BC|nr:carboxymuconolactone decarboxylase family protein [Luteimonas sp. BDR2-5]MCD9029004.1 carboxymuconolactone decarboxylase family protein [Luteimonas sp. BDR2-5]